MGLGRSLPNQHPHDETVGPRNQQVLGESQKGQTSIKKESIKSKEIIEKMTEKGIEFKATSLEKEG